MQDLKLWLSAFFLPNFLVSNCFYLEATIKKNCFLSTLTSSWLVTDLVIICRIGSVDNFFAFSTLKLIQFDSDKFLKFVFAPRKFSNDSFILRNCKKLFCISIWAWLAEFQLLIIIFICVNLYVARYFCLKAANFWKVCSLSAILALDFEKSWNIPVNGDSVINYKISLSDQHILWC